MLLVTLNNQEVVNRSAFKNVDFSRYTGQPVHKPTRIHKVGDTSGHLEFLHFILFAEYLLRLLNIQFFI